MKIPSTKPVVGRAFGPAAGLPPGAALSSHFASCFRGRRSGSARRGAFRLARNFTQTREWFFNAAELYATGGAGDLVAGDFPPKGAA